MARSTSIKRDGTVLKYGIVVGKVHQRADGMWIASGSGYTTRANRSRQRAARALSQGVRAGGSAGMKRVTPHSPAAIPPLPRPDADGFYAFGREFAVAEFPGAGWGIWDLRFEDPDSLGVGAPSAQAAWKYLHTDVLPTAKRSSRKHLDLGEYPKGRRASRGRRAQIPRLGDWTAKKSGKGYSEVRTYTKRYQGHGLKISGEPTNKDFSLLISHPSGRGYTLWETNFPNADEAWQYLVDHWAEIAD